ncbi:unnamed protein product [Mytilus edulis]|uniref:Uncharacterized protein n=1 Tax=Mytilus edulis TaxID=6550 RepID=A0A8S3TZQ3_MYTED|nr:unnamed protein product [Mytilus edulis]
MDTDNVNLGNKILYTLRTLQMSLLVIDSKENLIPGKTLLASWLYKYGKYNDCLQVTSAGLDNLDLCMFLNEERIMKADLFEKMLLCARDVTEFYHLSSNDIIYPIESSLVMKELSEILGARTTSLLSITNWIVHFCPITYSYMLRNLCYFELCDANRCEYAYAKMNTMCTTYCGNDSHRHMVTNFFVKLICNSIRHNITFDSRNILILLNHI